MQESLSASYMTKNERQKNEIWWDCRESCQKTGWMY